MGDQTYAQDKNARSDVNYTEQDILEFIQSVDWRYAAWPYDIAVGTERLESCQIQVYNENRTIYKRDLKRILEGGAPGYHPGLTAFLQFTPLENVPLFIHDIPELARWRLRIAK